MQETANLSAASAIAATTPRAKFGQHTGRWPFPVETAAAQHDAHKLAAATPGLLVLAYRVARLNPDAGEIGAGMLKTLVADARAVVQQADGSAAW